MHCTHIKNSQHVCKNFDNVSENVEIGCGTSPCASKRACPWKMQLVNCNTVLCLIWCQEHPADWRRFYKGLPALCRCVKPGVGSLVLAAWDSCCQLLSVGFNQAGLFVLQSELWSTLHTQREFEALVIAVPDAMLTEAMLQLCNRRSMLHLRRCAPETWINAYIVVTKDIP
jgi:hypothetical protein